MADVILLHYNLYGYVLVCSIVNFLQYFKKATTSHSLMRENVKKKEKKKSLCSDRRFKMKVKRFGDTISSGLTKTKQMNSELRKTLTEVF